MSTGDRIFVDATQPATLRYTGTCVSFAHLRSAIAAWRKLPASFRPTAVIASADGAKYDGLQIPALYDRRSVPREPAAGGETAAGS